MVEKQRPEVGDQMSVKDCNKCGYWKRRRSKFKGVHIPDSFGKCIRPGGHCDPDIVNGGIGVGPLDRRKSR
jgi:hypothetical protein